MPQQQEQLRSESFSHSIYPRKSGPGMRAQRKEVLGTHDMSGNTVSISTTPAIRSPFLKVLFPPSWPLFTTLLYSLCNHQTSDYDIEARQNAPSAKTATFPQSQLTPHRSKPAQPKTCQPQNQHRTGRACPTSALMEPTRSYPTQPSPAKRTKPRVGPPSQSSHQTYCLASSGDPECSNLSPVSSHGRR